MSSSCHRPGRAETRYTHRDSHARSRNVSTPVRGQPSLSNAAAPKHTILAWTDEGRSILRHAREVARGHVLAPLPDIARHIVDAELIRRLLSEPAVSHSPCFRSCHATASMSSLPLNRRPSGQCRPPRAASSHSVSEGRRNVQLPSANLGTIDAWIREPCDATQESAVPRDFVPRHVLERQVCALMHGWGSRGDRRRGSITLA